MQEKRPRQPLRCGALVVCVVVVSLGLGGCPRRNLVRLPEGDEPVGSKNTVNPVTPSSSPSTSPSKASGSKAPPPSLSPVVRPRPSVDLTVPPVGKSLQLRTSDGVVLAGSWTAPHDASQPTLILLHALSRQRNDWDTTAAEFEKSGYGILSIDFRGHGVSRMQGGSLIDWKQFQPADFGNMVLDVAAAVDFVKSQSSVNPRGIVIVGASIGANVALRYAADHPDIAALVLLSPGLDYRGVKTEAPMKKYGVRSVLLIASPQDAYAADSAKKLFAMTKGAARRSKLILSGAGHGTEMTIICPSLVKEIIAFLTEVLSPPKGIPLAPEATAAAPPRKVRGM